MKTTELTPLNNLTMGLTTESKQALSDKLEISKTHLLRIVKNPGRITIDQARIIHAHLVEVYGEKAVLDIFKI